VDTGEPIIRFVNAIEADARRDPPVERHLREVKRRVLIPGRGFPNNLEVVRRLRVINLDRGTDSAVRDDVRPRPRKYFEARRIEPGDRTSDAPLAPVGRRIGARYLPGRSQGGRGEHYPGHR